MKSPLEPIRVLPTPAKAEYIYDDAQGERQEYDYYAWTVGQKESNYAVYAALNQDIHPDVLERLSGKPLRFASKATFRVYTPEE